MAYIFILIWSTLRRHVCLSRESDATIAEKRYAPEDLALLSRVYAGLEWMLLRAKPKCPRSERVNRARRAGINKLSTSRSSPPGDLVIYESIFYVNAPTIPYACPVSGLMERHH